MRVSLLQENFTRALAAAKPFTASGDGIPVCKMVRLTTDRGMLRVDTTDLEKGFSTWVGAMVEDEGGICVSHKMLNDFVRTLASDRLDLEVGPVDEEAEPGIGGSNLVLTIRSGVNDTEATFNGVAVADFPPTIETEFNQPVAVLFDPDELAGNIRRVQLAAAKDESRPVLTGICLKLDDNGYELAAADGFRLACQRGNLIEAACQTGEIAPEAEPMEDPLQVVIPARTFTAMEKLLKSTEDPVRLNIDRDNSKAQFEVGSYLVLTQMIASEFPNYEPLIPDSPTWQVQTDAKVLKGAVESAAVYAVDGSNIIRFWTEQTAIPEEERTEDGPAMAGIIRVSARTEDVGYAKREAQCAEVMGLDGEDENLGRIAFNSKYVSELLKVVEGPLVLSANNPSSPGLWTLPDDETFKYVVMPMYVQW